MQRWWERAVSVLDPDDAGGCGRGLHDADGDKSAAKRRRASRGLSCPAAAPVNCSSAARRSVPGYGCSPASQSERRARGKMRQ